MSIALLLATAAFQMMNVAHRGLWQEANLPQNTVEAIKAAYDAGAKVVETDFVETKSGEIICLHDKKALASLSSIVVEPTAITAADRAKINLGEKMGLPRPYRIPLLQDVLSVVPKDAVLQAEIKVYGPTYAQKFDEAVKSAGLTETNFIISSFSYMALKDFHMKLPNYRTLWLGCDVGKPNFDFTKMLARAKDAGFDVICPGCAEARRVGFSPADADRVRAAGFDFRLFGVNSQPDLRYAASVKATGFTCNHHLAAYGWAKKVLGIQLLPDYGALIPDDFKGCLSDRVKTIGLVMPASLPNRKDYLRCKAWFEYAGYRVKEAPRMNFENVASAADRAADFEDMWLDPEVDLVFCVRGGRGAQDLIDIIDWKKLKARPDQRVLGFSNITWLLNTMLRQNVGHPISGPSLTQFRYLERSTLEWLREVFLEAELLPQQLKALREGAFSGLPCGGHIDILNGMAKRKVLPDATGRVVFLECSTRQPKLMKGYLDTILESGWLKDCAGIIFGDMTPGDAQMKKLEGLAREEALSEIEQIRKDFTARVTCPVYEGYDYGHIPRNFAIDFRRAALVSKEGVLTYK